MVYIPGSRQRSIPVSNFHLQSDYFVGAGITEQSELVYDCSSNVLYLTKVVPESSTTTLGLTMLMMLCTRRRRK